MFSRQREKLTSYGPRFGFLLELQQHAAPFLVILEEVHIIDDKNKWSASPLTAAKGDFFKLIQGFNTLLVLRMLAAGKQIPLSMSRPAPPRESKYSRSYIGFGPSLKRTFSGITSLEQTSLRVFIKFIVYSLSKPQAKDFKVRVSVAHRNAFCLTCRH